MFTNLFAQLDEAMRQLTQHGAVYSVTSSSTRISLRSSTGTMSAVMTVSSDGSMITIDGVRAY